MRRAAFTLYFTFVSMTVLCANPLGSFAPEALRMTGAELRMTFCETLLAEGHPERSRHPERSEGSQTEALITYLSRLLDETLIGDAQLMRLTEGLERGEVVNPISEVEVADFRLAVQRSGLEYLIQSGGFDPDMLLSWVREKLSERGAVQEQREVVHKETEVIFQPMEFVSVESGKFKMGEKDKYVDVFLSSRFAMAQFLVTQWQWAMVMGENPSGFVHGSESMEVKIKGVKIRMQPNHPVEQVSWDDVQKFIERLNKLSKTEDPVIYQVIADHMKGKVYGLPTDAQWERASGAGMNPYFPYFPFGHSKKLKDQAWFHETSKGKTHAVGLKHSNVFGLYDMHGNVWEWVCDRFWFGDLRGGINPTGPNMGFNHVIRGGSFLDVINHRPNPRDNFSPDVRRVNLGFRLIRVNAR